MTAKQIMAMDRKTLSVINKKPPRQLFLSRESGTEIIVVHKTIRYQRSIFASVMWHNKIIWLLFYERKKYLRTSTRQGTSNLTKFSFRRPLN